MNDIIVIVPARKGSKSIKNKNIILLDNHPLIAYSIAAGKMLNLRVLVSTDSEEYAEIATKYGADVPFIRPKEHSLDESTDREFILHAMNWLIENEKYNPEYWVHLRPTTPLRELNHLKDAIKKLKNNKNATSLRSAHKSPESPLKWFSKKDEEYFEGIIEKKYFIENEYYNLPKEKFSDIYIPDGYIDVLKSSHVLKSNNLHGDKILSYISPNYCTEVDTIEEFEYIKYLIEKKGSCLSDFLNTEVVK